MAFKIGSLFDGSGGFPLAASLCGGLPVWASEVEPYPIAVTKSRFPKMKHLGSVTDINGADIEPVDVITFGSPCQDLSVAGKRAGLKHEDNGDEETTRSGLFMEAVRIIKEMREATNGLYPTFAVWENVPGAFSSNKGEDFRTVLEELIKIAEPEAVMPTVPQGGWAYADSYCGDGWSIAYRVFDAQYWGVPQRRRRIYLVADFRGQCARKVLFERKGLRRDSETSRETREEAAGDAESCPRTANSEGVGIVNAIGGNAENYQVDECLPTLTNGTAPGFMNAVCYGISSKQQSLVTTENTDNTLGANDYKEPQAVCYGFDGYNSTDTGDKSATIGVNCGMSTGRNGVVYRQGGYGEYIENEVGTLRASGGDAGGGSENIVATRYVVRRLTPTECARLQGFPDKWGHPETKESLSEECYRFWLTVRNTHAAINGKTVKEYTKEQMLKWYNGLHSDSNEYKMWGNGIALPCALYVMQGIEEAME